MGFSERVAKICYVESDKMTRLPYSEKAALHFPPFPNEAFSKEFLDNRDAWKNQLFSLRLLETRYYTFSCGPLISQSHLVGDCNISNQDVGGL